MHGRKPNVRSPRVPSETGRWQSHPSPAFKLKHYLGSVSIAQIPPSALRPWPSLNAIVMPVVAFQ